MNRLSFALVVVFISLGGVFCSLAGPSPGLALRAAKIDSDVQMTCSPQEAESFWGKVDAIVELGRRARETGQPVKVEETFSEDEVNSALDGFASRYNDGLVTLEKIRVYFRDQFVYVFASCRILGMEITLSAVPEIWLENGKPKARVQSLNVQGAPGFVDGIITRIVNQRIDAEYDKIRQYPIYDYFEMSSIVFTFQQVTVTGVAR